MNLTKQEFEDRKQKKKRFLLIKELAEDEITPISIYHRLSGNKKFILESSMKHNEKGRFSYIGADPYLELKSNGEEIKLLTPKGEIYQEKGRVLDRLKELIEFEEMEADFPFVGGAIGYIGYDVIRQYEDIGEAKMDHVNMPEAHLLFYQTVFVYDHFLQKAYIVYVYQPDEKTSYEEMEDKYQEMMNQVTSISENPDQPAQFIKEFVSNVEKEEFCQMVGKAKEYIQKGDIFQVVLSLRFQTTFHGDPFDIYQQLRMANPSPYLFYIDFQDYIILGSSPESLVEVKGKQVITNPIAGTRPRGINDKQDQTYESQLQQDEKEIAEHRMLVDLGRNDLGRVSQLETVQVDRYMEIEKYSHVMHLVSEVSGELREGLTAIDALECCLPAGTVSGAPKIRAMTIINQLENVKRNVYSGAIGYISISGNTAMALAIRTMVIKGDQVYIQAGAGIVYDSDPESEYLESVNKAKALMEVVK
ncbi:anthranilate synthase component I [Risungbinella massiliensis]|uniref:anthranilate synthase component I n=1 Tax=Risungbinella massiliensis TaxID=1329796 RepID=UPI0005CBFC81|nr:anthranilate synthase component I [Risungbinella massiliensis]